MEGKGEKEKRRKGETCTGCITCALRDAANALWSMLSRPGFFTGSVVLSSHETLFEADDGAEGLSVT